MMLVQMLSRIRGAKYAGDPGETIMVEDTDGATLIEGGYAVAVAEPEPEPKAEPEAEPEVPEYDPADDLPMEPDSDVEVVFLYDLAIEPDVIELLDDEKIVTVADVEAFGDLTKIKGVGKVTARSIQEAIQKGVINNGE